MEIEMFRFWVGLIISIIWIIYCIPPRVTKDVVLGRLVDVRKLGQDRVEKMARQPPRTIGDDMDVFAATGVLLFRLGLLGYHF